MSFTEFGKGSIHKYQKYRLRKMSETQKHTFDHNKLIALVGGEENLDR